MKNNTGKSRSRKAARPRTEPFEVQLTKKERDTLENAAKHAGMDLASWLRGHLQIAARRELRAPRQRQGRGTVQSVKRSTSKWDEFLGMFKDDADARDVERLIQAHRDEWVRLL